MCSLNSAGLGCGVFAGGNSQYCVCYIRSFIQEAGAPGSLGSLVRLRAGGLGFLGPPHGSLPGPAVKGLRVSALWEPTFAHT